MKRRKLTLHEWGALITLGIILWVIFKYFKVPVG